MKDRRRTLPKVIGPPEQLDSRITPTTAGVRGTLAGGINLGPMTANIGHTNTSPLIGQLSRPIAQFMNASPLRPTISNPRILPLSNRPNQLGNVQLGTLINNFGAPFGLNTSTNIGAHNGSSGLSTTLSQLLLAPGGFNNGANGSFNNLGAINGGLSPTSPLGQLLLGSGGFSNNVGGGMGFSNGFNGGFNNNLTNGMGLTGLFPSFNNPVSPTSGLNMINGFGML